MIRSGKKGGMRPAGTIFQWIAVLLLLGPAMVASGCSDSKSTPGRTPEKLSPIHTGEKRCLSLRTLISQAREAVSTNKPIRDDVLHLGGIGRIEGFTIDRDRNDIILVGRYEPDRPALHLDDLVVMLRNVRHGETYPYCSLETASENTRKVSRMLKNRPQSPTEEELDRYCAGLQNATGQQTIIVKGVPRDSHMAHIMVDADYLMKRIGQGLERMDGVESRLEMRNEYVESLARRGDMEPGSHETVTRHWFHVEEDPSFIERDDIVYLKKCGVCLLTELQRVTRDGKLVGTGKEDVSADAWASHFTKFFVKTDVRVFRELNNLYRLLAVCHALHYRDAANRAGLDLSFLLTDYPYQASKPMPSSKPGLANYRVTELKDDRQRFISMHCSMLCGGVNMDMHVSATGAEPDDRVSHELILLRSSAIDARPDMESAWWLLRHEITHHHTVPQQVSASIR